MSFLEEYVSKHLLDDLSPKQQENINKLEEVLKEQVTNGSFEDILKQYGVQIADLVNRTSQAVSGEFSLSKLRVIINVAIEVYQLVDVMSDKVIKPDMSEEDKKSAKITFGQDLTYFIWMTVDPLKEYFNWLPFKKTIEKKLVKILAGYGIRAAIDIIKSNLQVSTLSARSIIRLRALP
jgi:hypothetical protein